MCFTIKPQFLEMKGGGKHKQWKPFGSFPSPRGLWHNYHTVDAWLSLQSFIEWTTLCMKINISSNRREWGGGSLSSITELTRRTAPYIQAYPFMSCTTLALWGLIRKPMKQTSAQKWEAPVQRAGGKKNLSHYTSISTSLRPSPRCGIRLTRLELDSR